MEAMHALLKAEQEKTALAQREAELARQEASRMRDEIDTMDPDFAGRVGQQIICAATVQQNKQEQAETIEQASRIFGKARRRRPHGGV
ncbi:hypothetical protein LSAT2_009581 [Lamellibrachia satsuma]|nr:hypothetical protein LSAT2_009581 [Lamellibrachia satsuma]